MAYNRVIPRDLFNEAKLLKCVGRFVLFIEDRKLPEALRYEYNGEAFEIRQDEDDGSISIWNIRFFVGKQAIFLSTGLNARSNYPLVCEDYDTYVFDDDGNVTQEFISYINKIK